MRSLIRMSWLTLLMAAVLLVPALAEKGTVLAVYKGSEFKTPAATPIKAQIENVLKKLGYKVVYHDIDKALPSAEEMKRFVAVLSWHQTARYKNPQAYIRWLRDQVLAGRKVVILGNFGAHTVDDKTWVTNEELNEFFKPFGLEYKAAYTGATDQLQVVEQNKKIVKGPVKPTYYILFSSHDSRNQGDLVIRRKDMPDSDSYLVVRTPAGALAGESYVWKDNAMRIDPMAFFTQALAPTPAASRLTPGGKLLGLFKGGEGTTVEENEVRWFLEKLLKEMGYTVDYRNIEDGLPSEADMSQYVGVITWYRSPALKGAAAYANWLTEQIAHGRKVVVFGNYGAFQEPLSADPNAPLDRWLLGEEYNNFFYPFGLQFKASWTNDPTKIREVSRDPEIVTWLEKSKVNHYFMFRPVSPENKSFLTLARTDLPNSESAVVVRTPYGGMALENYIVVFDGKESKNHLDLKKFLYDALTYRPTALPQPRSVAVKRTTVPQAPASRLAQSRPLPAGASDVKRRVLAFYTRSARETAVKNFVHDQAETVLNYLGLVVDYRAIEDGLPSDAEMEPYRGIITWWAEPRVPDAQGYNDWAIRQMKAGRKLVILGNVASDDDASLKSQADAGPMMSELGFKYIPTVTSGAVSVGPVELSMPDRGTSSIVKKDPAVCDYEARIDLGDKSFRKRDWPIARLEDPSGVAYLTTSDGRGESDVVAVSSHGGVALGEFPCVSPETRPLRAESLPSNVSTTEMAAIEETEYVKWRINPFLFFARAFATDDLPKADLSTLNGSRLFWAHVDGDASGGMSLIDKATLNSEMLYERIFSQSRLPFTVSYVTSDLTLRAKSHYVRELDAARRIQALPNVDTATHTTTHPFDWVEGDNSLQDGKLVRNPPSIDDEIAGSVDFHNQLIAPEKPVSLLLWSGLCNPTEEALAMCDALGIDNMNGGNPVYDKKYPYITGVYPAYSDVNGRIQYHTAAAGDFHYTTSWTRDFDGMKNLVEYFQMTEKPYRLRPMNVYFHFYLAERQLGLDGLQTALDYVEKQDCAPIFAADYPPIVADFITMKMGKMPDGALVVENLGNLRTIRFDNQKKFVDLSRSQGVIGYTVQDQSLYVHLDEGLEHRIFLQDQTPSQVNLERGSHNIEGWRPGPNKVAFRLKGTGPAFFTLANLAPNASYRVKVGGLGDQTLKTDSRGTLTWRGTLTAFRGTYPVEVTR